MTHLAQGQVCDNDSLGTGSGVLRAAGSRGCCNGACRSLAMARRLQLCRLSARQLSEAPKSLMKANSLEVFNFAYVNFCPSTVSLIFAVVYFQGVYPMFAVNAFSQPKGKHENHQKYLYSEDFQFYSNFNKGKHY